MAPVPLYLFAVTLPDLARESAALAVDGGIMPIAPVYVVTIATMTVGVAVLNAGQRHQVHQLIGVIVVCVSGAVAGGYLILQRVASDSLWGYYPAKLAWLLVTLLLVILAAGIASEMATLRGRTFAGPPASLWSRLRCLLPLCSSFRPRRRSRRRCSRRWPSQPIPESHQEIQRQSICSPWHTPGSRLSSSPTWTLESTNSSTAGCFSSSPQPLQTRSDTMPTS